MEKKYFILVGVLIAASSMILAQQPGAGPFTAQQAAAGQASYQANCAGCHQQNLGGSGATCVVSILGAAQ